MAGSTQAFDLAADPLVVADQVGAGLLTTVGVPDTFISGTQFPAVGAFREGMSMQTGGTSVDADNACV